MKIGMNTFTLKIIAIVAMIIDHVGVVFLPQYLFLRVIGRIAFPIFAYLLVEGFFYTHDIKKYMMRIGGLALLSEVPFDLVVKGKILEFDSQNVFFTLFLGLLMLYLMRRMPIGIDGYVCAFAIILAGRLLNVDYGVDGLLMIFWYYLYRDQKVLRALGIIGINVLLMGGVQSYGSLALIPISFHNGKQGPKMKGVFYGFYPIHLLIIYFISRIM